MEMEIWRWRYGAHRHVHLVISAHATELHLHRRVTPPQSLDIAALHLLFQIRYHLVTSLVAVNLVD